MKLPVTDYVKKYVHVHGCLRRDSDEGRKLVHFLKLIFLFDWVRCTYKILKYNGRAGETMPLKAKEK